MNIVSRLTKLFLVTLLAVSSVRMSAGWQKLVPEAAIRAAKTIGVGVVSGAGVGYITTQGFWSTVATGVFGGYQGYRNLRLEQKLDRNYDEIQVNGFAIDENGEAVGRVQTMLVDLSDDIMRVSNKVSENYSVLTGLCGAVDEQYADLLAKNLIIYDAVKENGRLIKMGINFDKEGFQAVLNGQEKIKQPWFGISNNDQENTSGCYSRDYFKMNEDEL